MKFGPADREIIRLLWESDSKGIDVYELHERYRLSPAQIVRSVNRFSIERILALDNDRLYFLEGGRSWVVKNRDKIFYGQAMPWKKIPDHFVRTSRGYVFSEGELGLAFRDDFTP
jgi:hypothetical protein